MRRLVARKHVGRALLVGVAVSVAACQVLFGIDEFVPATDPDAAAPDGAKPDVVVTPGTDGGADTSVPPVDNGCPVNRGPPMIRIGALCIDSTEVTEAQYDAFYAAVSPADAGQPPECTWNQTFEVGKGLPQEPTFCTSGSGGVYPVRCVDYCDALAFCKWAGKRLCGRPGGTDGEYSGFADPAKSEWMAACTGDAGVTFPYGNTFDDQKCNGVAGLGKGKPTIAGNLVTCEGPVIGLFDLSGNVHEWEAACTPGDGGGGAAGDRCRIRGGSMTDSDPNLLKCAAVNDAQRNFQASNVGFRCCATAKP